LSRSPEIRCAWLARLLVEDEEAKKFTEIKKLYFRDVPDYITQRRPRVLIPLAVSFGAVFFIALGIE